MTDRSPSWIKARIVEDARILESATEPISRGERGAMIGEFNKAVKGDANRRLLFGWLFGAKSDRHAVEEISSSVLTHGQVRALINWIDWYQDDEMNWRHSEQFDKDVTICMDEAFSAYDADRAYVSDPLFDEFERLGGEVTEHRYGESSREDTSFPDDIEF